MIYPYVALIIEPNKAALPRLLKAVALFAPVAVALLANAAAVPVARLAVFKPYAFAALMP
jgi:hypothetical protein